MKTVTLPFEEHEDLLSANDRMKSTIISLTEGEDIILIENLHTIHHGDRFKIVQGKEKVKEFLEEGFARNEQVLRDLRKIEMIRDKDRIMGMLPDWPYEDEYPTITKEVFRYKSGAITKTHATILYLIITGLILTLMFQ